MRSFIQEQMEVNKVKTVFFCLFFKWCNWCTLTVHMSSGGVAVSTITSQHRSQTTCMLADLEPSVVRAPTIFWPRFLNCRWPYVFFFFLWLSPPPHPHTHPRRSCNFSFRQVNGRTATAVPLHKWAGVNPRIRRSPTGEKKWQQD